MSATPSTISPAEMADTIESLLRAQDHLNKEAAAKSERIAALEAELKVKEASVQDLTAQLETAKQASASAVDPARITEAVQALARAGHVKGSEIAPLTQKLASAPDHAFLLLRDLAAELPTPIHEISGESFKAPSVKRAGSWSSKWSIGRK